MPAPESKNHNNQEDQHPVTDEPGFMAPQKPVLEEPLEGVDPGGTADEPLAPRPQTADPPSEEKIRINHDPLENTAVGHRHGEEDQARSPKAAKPGKMPYSPYFPRGVYEDARAVEEYYGPSSPAAPYHPFNREIDEVNRVMLNPIYRAILILFALLMILGILFLALTGRVAFPFL